MARPIVLGLRTGCGGVAPNGLGGRGGAVRHPQLTFRRFSQTSSSSSERMKNEILYAVWGLAAMLPPEARTGLVLVITYYIVGVCAMSWDRNTTQMESNLSILGAKLYARSSSA